MPHQIQKIIQTHQEHTRAQTQKKSYKPINETQKNHKRILYKKKKNQSTYIHKPNYPKEK